MPIIGPEKVKFEDKWNQNEFLTNLLQQEGVKHEDLLQNQGFFIKSGYRKAISRFIDPEFQIVNFNDIK